ncbi:2OG-Fe(II) oxygenase family protein [Paucibacter sediminis]|uniref:2OG-Fe(II) oxygenase family protein n=1 Tax=Paucibacter sediminis TaxID=3019553 RepID=A0AA95NJC4_9BURK|nr:2OG-Fe(II) oxygenase family protein [Paucibacter sp. S2-9]WIT13724.1 2OG-Fe(II) oxygenase family protein [Paucibacter sp. S2-9]
MQYINPQLDIEQLGRAFQRDGRLLIRDFFEPAVVEALSRAVDEIDWALTYRDVNGDRVLSGEQLRSLSAEQRAMLVDGINLVASQEFQFSFCTDSLVAAAKRGESHLLARFMRWMADEEFLASIRRITGVTDINRVYAQATMYTRGNFLVVHDDHVDAENRRLAYVINLTRNWRADWGGLLHFTGPQGDVLESYFPHFNSLSLFRVPQQHFVSYVPPFAQGERTAITGWLIAA